MIYADVRHDEEFKWLKMDRQIAILGPEACGHCGRTQTVPSDRIWKVAVRMFWSGLDTNGDRRVFRIEHMVGEKLNLFEAAALKSETEEEPMPEDPTDDAVETTGQENLPERPKL